MTGTKRTIYPIIALFVCVLVLLISSSSALATTFGNLNSQSGTHVDNAFSLAKSTYSSAPAVVITNVDNYGLSVSAGVLAKAYGGPLLMTSSSALAANVVSEVAALRPSKVFLVGLPASMAATVKSALPALTTGQIVTLTGADCYATAALVAQEVKAKLGTVTRVVIVPGNSYASGVAVSALASAKGWPIILTPAAGPFPAVSTQAIQNIGATSAVIVGTNVTPAISGFTVTKRIVGTATTEDPDGRYDASRQLAMYAVNQGWSSFSSVALVSGEDYPDGLVMGRYVGGKNGTILLTKPSALNSSTKALLTTYGTQISSVEFMGLGWPLYRQVKSLNAPTVTGLSATSGSVDGGNSVTVTGTKLNTVTKVRVGKKDLASSSYRINSSTSLTITSIPSGYGGGPVEVIATNYWWESAAGTKDLYWYVDGLSYPGDKVVREAVKYLGTPYLWGGYTPAMGLDCSGLAMYVYAKFGFALPHHAAWQVDYGTPVSLNALVPGDLVFFYTPIQHVGIYVGGGMMINAPRSGDLVIIENAYRPSLVQARRLIPYTATPAHQETDSHLTYMGSWGSSSTTSASGGSFKYANSAGSAVNIQFNGTKLSWVAGKGSSYGIAKVTVDNGSSAYVDLYSAGSLWQQTVWSSATLTSGVHTVTIEWTGTKNAASTGTSIGIDALVTSGNLLQAASVPRAGRYEESDSRIGSTGTWTTWNTASTSGGSSKYSNLLQAAVNVKFTGTYLSWIGIKGPLYGKAKVSVDGGTAQVVDLYSATSVYKSSVWNTGTLASGTHTVRIEWAGTKNASATNTYVGIDAFDVVGTLSQATATASGSAPTRYEQSDSHIAYTGTWTTWNTGYVSGSSCKYSNLSSAAVDVKFTGTYLSWVGIKGPLYGKARVTVDGGTAEVVDLYSPVSVYKSSVWNTGMLASGTHTVRIEWTGTKNASATNTYIGMDAFDVVGPLNQATAATSATTPAAPTTSVYEQTDSRLAYSSGWSTTVTSSASGGSFGYVNAAGSSVTLKFDGTCVDWIAKKSSVYGKAKVTLDTRAAVTVDLYAATVQWKQSVWNSGTLASGAHVLKIEWTGAKGAAASAANIGVDAFKITGTIKDAHASTGNHVAGKVVVIDPGHQQYANTANEPVGPGSAVLKMKCSAGTQGVVTGIAESKFALDLGLQLRDALKAQGITVVMTRTAQNVNLSNVDRAKTANSAHANLFVRLHADGWTDSSYNGIKVLYPATIKGWTDDIAAKSKIAATLAQQELTKATGAKNLGIVPRSDLAGFNWSDVPVILPEVGFMTNAAEDRLMATSAYRTKIVNGLVQGIVAYLRAN